MNFRTAAASMILASTGAQADTEGPSLPRVEVVGSRVPRIDGESALPVQIIRREEIERSGAATVEEVLGLVSANFGSTLEATTTANSLISGRSSASLRGLGAPRTLVLLNGRRVAQAQFTVAQNVNLLVGVQNLFDTNPSYSNVGDTLFGYDPTYADPRGRRWTVGLRANWP